MLRLLKGFGFVFMIFCVVLGCSEKPKKVISDKPNIIYLLTDDQRWDALGAMGNTIIQTPHLDEIANGGLLFKNAYVTTSICAVSRASMLTGQYESRHGIHDFKTGLSPDALEGTYPMQLKNKGYKIGFIGKYGVGEAKVHPKALFDFWACTEKSQPDYENTDKNGNYIHYTDVVANNIETFINEVDDRPFCLSVSFKAPHVQDVDPRQFIPNPRYADYYRDIVIPEPKTADPKYWESFPDFFRTDENIGRERWKLRFDTPEKYQRSVKNYYRLLTGVDDVVGALRKQLKEKGLDKNTVIVFMGDNGMFLGEHGLAGKWYPYEESVRVPLIIYDPRGGSPKGKMDQIALNIDIAPTILGFAGIDPPESMQGLDLVAAIKNNDSTRSAFFYEHSFFGSPKIPVTQGVISTGVKYIKYSEYDYEELFDLSRDPLEEINLVSDPKYTNVLEKQRSLYEDLKRMAK
ncbi:sulfatase [Ulvibacterium sp.]|uniref:sulfatase family protein n=1 Tax=Ulvibacterium sp. TaxID=2665914 RepID=UPI00261484BE|nr:sulfatase [Ulvibacterium sp.]